MSCDGLREVISEWPTGDPASMTDEELTAAETAKHVDAECRALPDRPPHTVQDCPLHRTNEALEKGATAACMTKLAARQAWRAAKTCGVKIQVRPANPQAPEQRGKKWLPKPQWLKNKTMDDIDVKVMEIWRSHDVHGRGYGRAGGPVGDLSPHRGKVCLYNPPLLLSTVSGDVPADVEARIKQRRTEWADAVGPEALEGYGAGQRAAAQAALQKKADEAQEELKRKKVEVKLNGFFVEGKPADTAEFAPYTGDYDLYKIIGVEPGGTGPVEVAHRPSEIDGPAVWNGAQPWPPSAPRPTLREKWACVQAKLDQPPFSRQHGEVYSWPPKRREDGGEMERAFEAKMKADMIKKHTFEEPLTEFGPDEIRVGYACFGDKDRALEALEQWVEYATEWRRVRKGATWDGEWRSKWHFDGVAVERYRGFVWVPDYEEREKAAKGQTS